MAKETLAFLVLFQFPVELGTALLAGRWASLHTPYAPFIAGYALRLAVCAALLLLTNAFPAGAASLSEHPGAFGMLAGLSLLSSFGSTLTFTALGSFFNHVSDPGMGGESKGRVWGLWPVCWGSGTGSVARGLIRRPLNVQGVFLVG